MTMLASRMAWAVSFSSHSAAARSACHTSARPVNAGAVSQNSSRFDSSCPLVIGASASHLGVFRHNSLFPGPGRDERPPSPPPGPLRDGESACGAISSSVVIGLKQHPPIVFEVLLRAQAKSVSFFPTKSRSFEPFGSKTNLCWLQMARTPHRRFGSLQVPALDFGGGSEGGGVQGMADCRNRGR